MFALKKTEVQVLAVPLTEAALDLVPDRIRHVLVVDRHPTLLLKEIFHAPALDRMTK